MLARFFIDRPIFAWVLSLVIVLIGGVAAVFLPVGLYPPVVPPTVQVVARYPGANAKVVADTIGQPIEEQVNGVENMLYMSSQSTNNGDYTLVVTFAIGTDPNEAQVLVQNRVALAMPQLPPQVQLEGVSTKKTSTDILLAVSLFAPDGRYDDLYLSNYATINIQNELARLKGVGDVQIFGQRLYAMRVWVDPNKLASRKLTATDLVSAVRAQNAQVVAGEVGRPPAPSGQRLQLTMSALGRLDTIKQFGDIVLKTEPPGSPDRLIASPVVRLRDVARIELGAQDYSTIGRLDGKPSAGVGIFLLPGANALAVSDAVKKKMEELKADFPPGLEYGILYDTTPFIRESVNEVLRTLFMAVLLVAAVVLLFLQDWKAMILPMIDVPVSLVGTFAVMSVLGYSLNNLTLFGLVLSIGIVVDDSIVILENIERLIATGLSVRDATLKAMDEITGPIVAITLVLIAVFLPSAFVPGLTGQFYRQFVVTISSAMIISALNALTLTPARAVFIFKTEEGKGREATHEALPWWIFAVAGGALSFWLAQTFLGNRLESNVAWRHYGLLALACLPGVLVGGALGWFVIGWVNAALAWLFGGFNRAFTWLTSLYGRFVGRLLALSIIVGVVYVALLGLTVWRVETAPVGFLPEQDQGYLLASVQLPDGASLERTSAIMARIDKIARAAPGVGHTVAFSGESFVQRTTASNLGSMFIVLKPFSERESAGTYDAAIAMSIQAECRKQIEGAVVNVFRAPPIHGLGNVGGFQLQTEQRGSANLDLLDAQTQALIHTARENPDFAYLSTESRPKIPQVFLDIDRTKVESLGVPVEDVFTTLQVYMGGLYVNQFNRFGRTWQVQVQAEPEFRATSAAVKQLQVRNKANEMIPMGTLVRPRNATGPLVVMRYNMYLSEAINGIAAPGVSSGTTVEDITRAAEQTGTRFEWTGLSYLQVEEGNVSYLVFGLGAILVYLVLAAKYESWRLPMAVILVVPLCLLVAIEGMQLAHLPVDIFVHIGLLVLVGLASKNAILIVEFARDLRMQGRDVRDAAREASEIRFRPIIMTSLAFIFGVLPLVLATGAGAEMRRSLGTAVFSGMIGVTVFGIFLTPVFFQLLERRGAKPGEAKHVTLEKTHPS